MKTERTGWAATCLWIMAIIAVPVVYLLGIPILNNAKIYWYGFDAPYPRAYQTLCLPMKWCYENTPLREPLDSYSYWIARHMPPSRVPSALRID